MTKQELINTVEELLQDHEPMELCEWFYDLYEKDKIEFTDLEFLVSLCGFDLADEFKNATDEERKAMMAEEEPEDLLEDEEEAKPEEGEEKPEAEPEAPEGEEDRASKSEGYDGEKVYDKEGNPAQSGAKLDSDNEEEEAQKLYNMKFNK